MKLIIFGYAQHGKDTACLYLRDRYGLSFSASSMFACRAFLYEQIKDRFGYTSLKACFEDRGAHRQLWYEAIRDYNTPDRTRLGRGIFAEHQVYCGIRDRDEFEALRAAGAFDLAIWIDASQRKPPESSSSMKLTSDDADLVLDNNGGLLTLYRNLDELVVNLGLAAPAAAAAK